MALKAQLDNAGAQAVVPPILRPATTFHGFKKLPNEIQDMIWKLSFRQPRIFRVCDLAEAKDAQPVVVSHKPLGSGQACRRSRLLYQQSTNYAFGSCGGIRKSLRVSPDYDILYLDMDLRQFLGRNGQSRASLLLFDLINQFKNFALNLPQNSESIRELVQKLKLFIYPCSKRKNLIFVVKDKSLPKTDVTFFDIKDTFGEIIHFDTRNYYWKDLKKKAKGILRAWSNLSKLLDIRAVEVAPIRTHDS